MIQVTIGELEAGMVLAADVEDNRGYRILAKDTVLTEKLLALLSSWRVEHVLVEESKATPEGLDAALSAEEEALREAKSRLAKKFEGAEINEWIETLHLEAQKRLSLPRYWKTQM